MEDNNNYTYTYRREKKKEIQRIRIIIIAVYAVLAVLCIIFGVLFGNRSAVKAHENELSSQEAEAQNTTEEPVTEEPSPYKPGEYAVNTEGYSLKFRKDHTTGSDVYLEISDGTKLTVEEIYHDVNATASGSDIEYWGKITYKGYTGWVAMNYMKKAYSDNIVTPDDITTQESTTEAPVTTTEAPSTTEPSTQAPKTEPESSENAPSQENTTEARYTAGDYIVSTGGYTLTFRKSASKNGETILSIEDGVKLTVTKIVETADENEKYRYWGEVTYKGHTGYVSMAYLKRAS